MDRVHSGLQDGDLLMVQGKEAAEVFISKCWIILFHTMLMFCRSAIEIACAAVFFCAFDGVALAAGLIYVT